MYARRGVEPSQTAICARLDNRAPVSVDHYENFPVASWLCPPRLRRRSRRSTLCAHGRRHRRRRRRQRRPSAWPTWRAYRADLRRGRRRRRRAGRAGRRCSAPLARGDRASTALPPALLHDLLAAFVQDVRRATQLRRPRRAARLLPPLGQPDRPPAAAPVRRRRRRSRCAQSDAICSALQLINFWQDLSVDLPRGRFYLPQADCAPPRRASPTRRCAPTAPARRRALVRELVRLGARS